MALDWTKPIQTVDGHQAYLVGKINYSAAPYVVAIGWDDDGKNIQSVYMFTEDGTTQFEAITLKNIPNRIKVWVNVYTRSPDEMGALVYFDEASAKEEARTLSNFAGTGSVEIDLK